MITELQHVESPFLNQLTGMGWTCVAGNASDPVASRRKRFSEVYLWQDVREAVRRLNLRPDGRMWLDDYRVEQAIMALERAGAMDLQQANAAVTVLLLNGAEADGVPDWDDGRKRVVQFIDWENPERNTFTAIQQFRVDEPGTEGRRYIVPDIVLFVNGIPLVVVECKSPTAASPLAAAIEQLQRYSGQRPGVEMREGNPALFHANQLMIATTFDEARVATLTSESHHYLEWKDTYPQSQDDVARGLGKTELSSQERLVAGMLDRATLLDLVRHFTVTMVAGSRIVKVVARYQQYRAARKAISRMATGRAPLEGSHKDERGGVIWHTQGSGKSLTMAFLIRAMRSHKDLRAFKVVVVSDRRDLEAQLSQTLHLVGETITVVKAERTVAGVRSASAKLQDTLRAEGRALVFTMIQKYRGEVGGEDDPDPVGRASPAEPGTEVAFPLLNDSSKILVLIDEAHRTHASSLHGSLRAAMPNAVRIGFTGTPIIMGARTKTEDIFGPLIDSYTILQSQDDGATVPIVYEGRAIHMEVSHKEILDKVFEGLVVEHSPAEVKALQEKYVTREQVAETPALIRLKARDMLRHYVTRVMPNGFKAQVVASSRRAAVTYVAALGEARDALVAELEAAPIGMSDEMRPDVDTLRRLEFAAVISGGQNDDPAWRTFTDSTATDARIAAFKQPLHHADSKKSSPLAFLVVKSMLLTGFDAPVEQVLYLDRSIAEAELLQAIARVNRTAGPKKQSGLVVDYHGVLDNLTEALSAYSQADVRGALRNSVDQLAVLQERYLGLRDLVNRDGVPREDLLTDAERGWLVERFCTWSHSAAVASVPDSVFRLGADSADARAVVDLFERFLLYSVPSGQEWARLHAKVVVPLRTLIAAKDARSPEAQVAVVPLATSVEPALNKLVRMCSPDLWELWQNPKKRPAGLGTALGQAHALVPMRAGFDYGKDVGWETRTSFEHALRPIVKVRNDAAHRAADFEADFWECAMVVLLGLVAHNRERLAHLPAPRVLGDRDMDHYVAMLEDAAVRAEFEQKVRAFLSTLDSALPNPEALRYIPAARFWGEVAVRVRRRYRTNDVVLGRDMGAKVCALIEAHVTAQGIQSAGEPVSITDPEFQRMVNEASTPGARVSELEQGLREHLKCHLNEDPAHFGRLSERLEEIIERMRGDLGAQEAALRALIEQARAGRQEELNGLDPRTQAPYFDLLKQALVAAGGLDSEKEARLVALTLQVTEEMDERARRVGFWSRKHDVEEMTGAVVVLLDASDLFPLEHMERAIELAGRLTQLRGTNRG